MSVARWFVGKREEANRVFLGLRGLSAATDNHWPEQGRRAHQRRFVCRDCPKDFASSIGLPGKSLGGDATRSAQ